MTHSSVNFTWFAFLSPQRFDDRTLFKSVALIRVTLKSPQTNIFPRLE